MADTRIEDVINPELFTQRVQQLSTTKANFLNSPAVQRDPILDAFLNGPGNTISVHSYKDIADDVEDNVSSDDPAVKSTPNKIGASSEVVTRLSRNVSFSTMDLARDLALSDPADAIANRVTDFWTRQVQKASLSTVAGVLAENDANGGGDLTLNVATAEEAISSSNVVDALASLGDSQDQLQTIVMHSVTKATLWKQRLLGTFVDPATSLQYDSFLGMPIVVDDSMANDGSVYTTLIVGGGAFTYGLGSPTVPTEVERDGSAGNGGGQSILHSRTEIATHVAGMAFTGTPNPTNAVLADAASWARVFESRKQIPFVRLVTKEA